MRLTRNYVSEPTNDNFKTINEVSESHNRNRYLTNNHTASLPNHRF